MTKNANFQTSSFGFRIVSNFDIRNSDLILAHWRPFGGVYPFDSLRAGSDRGRAQDRRGAKNCVEIAAEYSISISR